ncbi:putative bifunctional diguanylate cyclase/phosphodiesterase [Mycobacterium sp. C31M]
MVATACVLFVVFATWLTCGWGGPTVVGAVSDLGSIVAGMLAAGCTAVAFRRCRGRRRRAWGMLTLALGCWVLGDIVWAAHTLVLDTAPFPSPADAGYLLFYVFACVALVRLPPTSAHQFIRLTFDGMIVAGSLFVIVWSAGLATVFGDSEGSRFAVALAVTYPFADVLLLTVALLILASAPTGQRGVLTSVALGMSLLAVADAAFALLDVSGRYRSGGPVDIAWVGGLLMLGVAAAVGESRHHHAAEAPFVPSRLAFWLPYVPLVGAVVTVVQTRSSAPLMVAALLVCVAVAGRQFVVADENRRLLASLSDRVSRDPLTGLANWATLHGRLSDDLARRHSGEIVLLVLDLDDFKSVNDSLGHVAGDALLVAVSERLRGCVRTDQMVARLGGDEFAIVGSDEPGSPYALAQRVFSSFDDPFPVDGHHVLARPSIGVATAAGDTLPVTADVLLKHADLAMYSAKRNGGGVRHFAAEMERAEPDALRADRFIPRRSRNRTLQFADQLRQALVNGELGVVYQPQFGVTSGKMLAVETLVRWHHPQRGMVRPDEFLPVARHNDLMGELTDEVLRTAVRDVAQWRDNGVHLPIAINLFPPSLGDPRLPEHLAEILGRGGLDGSALTVEITEDVMLANEPTAREVLHRLRSMGTRVSIDDFGSGYAGLNYLRQLPIDEVKLDRQLIAPMTTDPRAESIVAAMIGLCHTLGVTCVAEGVENQTTVRRLAELDCDVMQGFFCGPPVTAAALDAAAVKGGRPPERIRRPGPARRRLSSGSR